MNNSTKKLLIGAVAAAAIGGYVYNKRSNPMEEGIPAGEEKCYGAALKGENSCSNQETCSVTLNNCDPKEWKLVPKGTCEEAVKKCQETAAQEAHETPAAEAAEHETPAAEAAEHDIPSHAGAEPEEEPKVVTVPGHQEKFQHEAAKHPAHHAAAHHEAKHPAHHAVAKHPVKKAAAHHAEAPAKTAAAK